MPKVKTPEELDIEIQVEKPSSKDTRILSSFEEKCPDNPSDMRAVCELTARSCAAQFNMYSDSGKYESYGLVFFGIFESILEFLKSQQSKYKNYTILFGRSVNIGYENSSSTDNEKLGNFMPILECTGVNQPVTRVEQESDSTKKSSEMVFDEIKEKALRWMSLNTKHTESHYHTIEENALEHVMQKYGINLRLSALIIPIFCTFMDNVNNVIRQKFREHVGMSISEVTMPVFGLFTVSYSEGENGREYIEYVPTPFFKTSLKSDTLAAAQ